MLGSIFSAIFAKMASFLNTNVMITKLTVFWIKNAIFSPNFSAKMLSKSHHRSLEHNATGYNRASANGWCDIQA
jgi:hypothetical protein